MTSLLLMQRTVKKYGPHESQSSLLVVLRQLHIIIRSWYGSKCFLYWLGILGEAPAVLLRRRMTTVLTLLPSLSHMPSLAVRATCCRSWRLHPLPTSPLLPQTETKYQHHTTRMKLKHRLYIWWQLYARCSRELYILWIIID